MPTLSYGQRKWSFQLLLRKKSSLDTKSTLPLKQILSLLNSYLNADTRTQFMDKKKRGVISCLICTGKPFVARVLAASNVVIRILRGQRRQRNIHSFSHPIRKAAFVIKGWWWKRLSQRTGLKVADVRKTKRKDQWKSAK